MAWAVGLPALASFGVGTTSSLVNDRWRRFKILWAMSTALGFVAAPIMLWALQSDFLGSWLLIASISALVSFVAHAEGAVRANPNYRPEGKNPLGMAIEFVIIAVLSVVAGIIWNQIPGGQGSGWIFATLLGLSVGYIHFAYDDRPKGLVRKDMLLLIVSLVIEAVMLAVSAFVIWVVLTLLSIGAGLAQLSAIETRLGQADTFMLLLLVAWVSLNGVLWWVNQEPKEAKYQYHELP